MNFYICMVIVWVFYDIDINDIYSDDLMCRCGDELVIVVLFSVVIGVVWIGDIFVYFNDIIVIFYI